MATTFRTSGNYVYINNVRFGKNSLTGDKTSNGWVLRGNSLDSVANNVEYDTAIDVNTDQIFQDEPSLDTWITENVLTSTETGSGNQVLAYNNGQLSISGGNQVNINNMGGQFYDGAVNDIDLGHSGFGVFETEGSGAPGGGSGLYAYYQRQAPDGSSDFGFWASADPNFSGIYARWKDQSNNWTNFSLLVTEAQLQANSVLLGGQQTTGPMIIGATNNQDLALISNNATLLLLQTDGAITATGDLHMSEKKVINIADGTDPRDAVSVRQSDLQNVTLRGHTTDRGINISGSAGGSPTDGLSLGNDADLGVATVFGYNGNVQSGGLSIGPNGTEVSFGTHATMTLTQENILIEHHASGSNIGLTAQDAGNSGVQISARVTVQDAVLPVEATTLQQVQAMIAAAMST